MSPRSVAERPDSPLLLLTELRPRHFAAGFFHFDGDITMASRAIGELPAAIAAAIGGLGVAVSFGVSGGPLTAQPLSEHSKS